MTVLSNTDDKNKQESEQSSGAVTEIREAETQPPENQETPTTEPDPPQPLSPPAQPIAFESYDDILRFIRNYDGTWDSCPEAKDYWPEEFVAAYLKMVDSYKSDGFFYEITDSEGLKKEAYTLYPDVTYEDIGIRVCLVDGEDWYQCIIYTTRDNARIMGDGHSLYDYMKDRMGLKKDIRDENSDREILRYINSDPENGYSSYIETPIDETHYLCIRTRASGDDVYEKMCDLYESLSFTKRTIQQ